ncbi:pectinesterase-like [Rosa rugosa]|uniref:pectinesterase-like n=1 Tax=Rosa rugosa TaxID=74645 RepID=UPI002B402B12|nr:pectinesterase-like [Rosa rugosa]
MGVPGGNKRIIIITVSSALLVAMVVGAVVGVIQYKKQEQRGGGGGGGGDGDGDGDSKPGDKNAVRTSKPIVAICQPTNYKQECENSLQKEAGDKRDPKDLARVGIQVAINKLDEAIRNSKTLPDQAKDPMTKQALHICNQLLNASMYDLKISFNKMGALDLEKVDEYAEDVEVWLSGAVSHQATCIDESQNTTEDVGKKMKEILKSAHESTSNALAMVTEITNALNSLHFKSNRRRLLASSPPSKNNNNNKNNQHKQNGNKSNQGLPSWLTDRKLDLLTATPETLKPNVTVAQDGNSKYKTINEALKLVPKKSNDLFVIYVKEGVYKESVTVAGMMENVVMIGDGPTKSRISGDNNFASGTRTMYTATVAVVGNFFVAKDIGFENTAGAKGHQAVALRVQSDFSIFYNCHIDGYQNTLYVQAYRNYFRDCNITGTIDFIFGDAVSLFQNCEIVVRKPMDNQTCIVTAQGKTDKNEVTGIVLQNCTIRGDPEYENKGYLGRPWKNFAKTVVMQSQIDDVIQPEGYMPWDGAKFHMTSFFGEYDNRGPGADMSSRAGWPSIKKLDDKQAKAYSGKKWFEGDRWVKPSGVPFVSGIM